MILFIIFAALIAFTTAAGIALPIFRTRDSDAGIISKRSRFSALLAAGLVPMAAGFVYLMIGTPIALDPSALARAAIAGDAAVIDPSAAIAALPPDERAVMIENMVAGLSARLATEPDDLDGWRMLARSYGVLGRQEDAAQAWGKAAELSDGKPEDWRGVALALTEADREKHAAAIVEAFEKILSQRPQDPLALYFLGTHARDTGDNARAHELWTDLRTQVPNDVPFAQELDALIASVEP